MTRRILRQSPCAHFEANVLYLLVGTRKALLIDTGAIADTAAMPLTRTVLELLPGAGHAKLPLLVVHTHGHADHRAGGAQLAALPALEFVPTGMDEVRAFFGFDQWPNGEARLDLGGRSIAVIPTPGHHPAHLVFYDDRTAALANFNGFYARHANYILTNPLRNLLALASAALALLVLIALSARGWLRRRRRNLERQIA